MSRRRFIKGLAGISILGVLAGCSEEGIDDGDSSDTTTNIDDQEENDEEELKLSAQVLESASGNSINKIVLSPLPERSKNNDLITEIDGNVEQIDYRMSLVTPEGSVKLVEAENIELEEFNETEYEQQSINYEKVWDEIEPMVNQIDTEGVYKIVKEIEGQGENVQEEISLEFDLPDIDHTINLSEEEVELGEEVELDAESDASDYFDHIWKVDGEEYEGDTVNIDIEDTGEIPIELVVKGDHQKKSLSTEINSSLWENKGMRQKHMEVRPSVDELDFDVGLQISDYFVVNDEEATRRLLRTFYDEELVEERDEWFDLTPLRDLVDFEYENLRARSWGYYYPKIYEFKNVDDVKDKIESVTAPEDEYRGLPIYRENLEREGYWNEDYLISVDDQRDLIILTNDSRSDSLGDAMERIEMTIDTMNGQVESLKEQLDEDYEYIDSDYHRENLIVTESIGEIMPRTPVTDDMFQGPPARITGTSNDGERLHNGFMVHSVYFDEEDEALYQMDSGPVKNDSAYEEALEEGLRPSRDLNEWDLEHELEDSEKYLSRKSFGVNR